MMTENSILPKDCDPMGQAILDYQTTGKASTLKVLSTMFDDDEMSVPYLFRTEESFPVLERVALGMASGRVLDVGAGAGCHAIALQNKGLDVTAIDVSPLSCEAMRLRGLKNVQCVNFFSPMFDERFDTILMLMNGTGIAGELENLPNLLRRAASLLADGGKILIDSSDLKYLFENEDGSFDIDLNDKYYGEVDYQMQYRKVKGKPFNWLYVDFPMLKAVAEDCGLKCKMVEQGNHYDYLAQITK